MKKSILSLTLVFALLLLPLNVNAQQTEVKSKGNTVKAILVLDGKKIELDANEYKEYMENAAKENIQIDIQKKEYVSNLLKNNNALSNEMDSLRFFNTIKYYESNNNPRMTRFDLRRVISSVKFNGSSSPSTHKFTYKVSQKVNSNITLSASIKDVIGAAIGRTVESTASMESTDTYTLQPNNYGWILYTPIMYNTYGSIVTNDDWDTAEYVDVYIPYLQDDGLPNGIYAFMEDTHRPEELGYN